MDESGIDRKSLATLAAWREKKNSNKPSERIAYRASLIDDIELENKDKKSRKGVESAKVDENGIGKEIVDAASMTFEATYLLPPSFQPAPGNQNC